MTERETLYTGGVPPFHPFGIFMWPSPECSNQGKTGKPRLHDFRGPEYWEIPDSWMAL